MRPDELISRIRLPRRSAEEPALHWYRKVGTRKAQAISKVVFAGLALLSEDRIADVRLALGSVAPVTVRCTRTEAVLRGKAPSRELVDAARAELAREIAPIDDIRSTAVYRLRVAQNLLEEFVGKLR